MVSKKVFIAGPIENVDEFNKTENELTELGFSVINPQKFWSLPKNEGYAKYENPLVTDIMPLHICALNLCRYIYLISGWHKDEIAAIEFDYALKTGKWVLTKESMFEFLKDEAASDNPFFKVAYNKFMELLMQSSSYSTDNKHKDDRLDATHMEDVIHHPKHYQGKNGMEVIDVIDNFACDPVPENCIYDEGNAIKYLLRWAKKNGIEDLNKCKEYIDFMIKKLEDNPVK